MSCVLDIRVTVLFVTAAEMVNHLQHAQKTYNLEAELNKYRKPQLLIIDELGYVALDTQASKGIGSRTPEPSSRRFGVLICRTDYYNPKI